MYTSGVQQYTQYHKKKRRIEGRIEGGRKENGRGGRREDRREDRRIHGTQSVRVRRDPEMKEEYDWIGVHD